MMAERRSRRSAICVQRERYPIADLRGMTEAVELKDYLHVIRVRKWIVRGAY
jgi:hypothetical protein